MGSEQFQGNLFFDVLYQRTPEGGSLKGSEEPPSGGAQSGSGNWLATSNSHCWRVPKRARLLL